MMRNKYPLVIALALVLVAGAFLISAATDQPVANEVRPSTVKPFELPEQLDFAGEGMPLGRLDVKEKLDREILVNTYWQSNNLLMLKRSAKFFPIIEPIDRKSVV